MSRAWDLDRPELARHPGVRTAVDLIADAAEVDYMPTVNPDKARPAAEPMVTIPARLLAAVRADVISDRDRARGERGLLAPAGSATAARANAPRDALAGAASGLRGADRLAVRGWLVKHTIPRSTGGGQLAFLLALGRALFTIAVVVLVLSTI